MEIEVRKATLDDVDALVDIRREFQLEAKGTRGTRPLPRPCGCIWNGLCLGRRL